VYPTKRSPTSGERRQFCFRREERLKSAGAIRRVFNEGKRAACSGAKLFYRENALSCNRIAFTFGRKYGNAVERNHSRRLSREAYRLSRPFLKTGFDLVLLVYPGNDQYQSRFRQLRLLFHRAALVAERGCWNDRA
jgi:ribonuclease P protein component